MQRGRLLIILGVVLGLLTVGAVAFLLLGGAGAGLLGDGGPEPEEDVVAPPEPTGIPTTQVLVAVIGRLIMCPQIPLPTKQKQ